MKWIVCRLKKKKDLKRGEGSTYSYYFLIGVPSIGTNKHLLVRIDIPSINTLSTMSAATFYPLYHLSQYSTSTISVSIQCHSSSTVLILLNGCGVFTNVLITAVLTGWWSLRSLPYATHSRHTNTMVYNIASLWEANKQDLY